MSSKKLPLYVPEDKKENDSFGFIMPKLPSKSIMESGEFFSLPNCQDTFCIVYSEEKSLAEVTELEALAIYGFPKYVLDEIFEEIYAEFDFWSGESTLIQMVVIVRMSDEKQIKKETSKGIPSGNKQFSSYNSNEIPDNTGYMFG